MQSLPDLLGIQNPLISPLDFTNLSAVEHHLSTVGTHAGLVKVGSMVLKHLGEHKVAQLVNQTGVQVMWDEKFADIPFQTQGAVSGVCSLVKPKVITVHLSSGTGTVKDAVAAAGSDVIVAGISVLTSIGEPEAQRIYGSGRTIEQVVLDLALLGFEAGVRALVCSARELLFLKEQTNTYPQLNQLYTIVPGIRAVDSPPDDQNRKATPYEAGLWGADMIVVGRLVSRAPDPAEAVKTVTQQFLAGVKSRNN